MADEKLNMGSAENTSPTAASLSLHPNRPQRLSPGRNRPGLPYLSPAMWLCPLTKSMSLWWKRDRTLAPKSKRRKLPKCRRWQFLEKHRSLPIRRSRKSCAVVVRRKQKRPRLKNRTKMLFTASWTKSVPRESIITFIPSQEVPSSYGSIALVLLNFCVLSHLLIPVDDF